MSRRRGERRSWKDFTVEDFRRYYEDNYAGMSRTDVEKRDSGFFCTVTRKGFSDQVFPPKVRKKWDGFTLEDFQELYNQNYAGMSRCEVYKADSSFYEAVMRRDYADEVFLVRLRRPHGYWQDFDNIRNELEPIIQELGRFPTTAEINLRNKAFMTSIRTYHGGLTGVREKMGCSYEKRPNDYWKNLDNVRKEFDDLIKKLGHFPTSSEIAKENSSLGGAISKYHGGIREMQEIYGEKGKKPDHYWSDEDNVRKELEKVIQELGRFPTAKEIQKMCGSLLSGINNVFGGVLAARRAYGYKPIIRVPGYWMELENVGKELEVLCDELGRYPTYKEINLKIPGLAYSLEKYHGGYIAMKIKLGYADEELDVLRQIVEDAGREEGDE